MKWMGLGLAAMLATGSAWGQASPQQPPPPAQQQAVTKSLQGGADAWRDNPMIREWYGLTVVAFAHGPDKVDLKAYRESCFDAIRRNTPDKKTADGLIDHIKGIPDSMPGIVKDDPKVLDSFKAFSEALSGPA